MCYQLIRIQVMEDWTFVLESGPQLIQVMEDWILVLELGHQVDIIYLDLRKAFDTVPHARLLCRS